MKGDDSIDTSIRDKVISVESLLKATQVCKKGVLWKDSVAGFVKNEIPNCIRLHDELENGTYKLSPYQRFTIYEPKKREIVATRIRDRVVQRSLCDNYLIPQITKSFIYDNCACLKGRGPDFGRERLKVHLQKYYRKNGFEGYVLFCDIHDFFGSTPHWVTKAAVRRYVSDEWVLMMVDNIIDRYCTSDDRPEVGTEIGSLIMMIVQLSVLDPLDHILKERFKIKHYLRYMDDFILIHQSKSYLKECLNFIKEFLLNIGLTLNLKKTQIIKLGQPIHFLGFSFRLTETGKVIITVLKKKLSHERRRLKKQYKILPKNKVDQCFSSYLSHISYGNCYFAVSNMIAFYCKLIVNGGYVNELH